MQKEILPVLLLGFGHKAYWLSADFNLRNKIMLRSFN
jgi:hypothetical protein